MLLCSDVARRAAILEAPIRHRFLFVIGSPFTHNTVSLHVSLVAYGTLQRAMRLLLCWIVVLAIAAVAYQPTSFQPTHTRDLPLGMQFAWAINATHIRLAVTAPTADGWVSFGVGESPLATMAGGDFAIGYFRADGGTQVGDYYANRNGRPLLDCDLEMDWELLAAARNATHTSFELARALDALNPQQDRPIQRPPANVTSADPTKVMFAYGAISATEVEGSFPKPNYHGASRYQTNVPLFDTPQQAANRSRGAPAVLDARGVPFATYDIAVGNVTLPARKTDYHMTPCQTGPNMTGAAADGWATTNGSQAYLVGFEVVADPAMARYVHHLVLKGWHSVAGCQTYDFMQMTDVWAVASVHEPYVFPVDVGMSLSQWAAINVQIHYDNPELWDNITDTTTAVRLFYTYTAQPHELGVLQLADPAVETRIGLPPGVATYTYECPSGCTDGTWGDTTAINVIGDLPHMHMHGQAMSLTVYDGDSDNATRFSMGLEYYSAHAQRNRHFEPPLQVHKGDRMVVSCTYQSRGNVTFGAGSEEEMCIWFLYYWPAVSSLVGGKYCGIGGLCGTMLSGPTNATTPTNETIAQHRQSFGYAGNDHCDTFAPTLMPPTPAPTPEPSTATPVPALPPTSPGEAVFFFGIHPSPQSVTEAQLRQAIANFTGANVNDVDIVVFSRTTGMVRFRFVGANATQHNAFLSANLASGGAAIGIPNLAAAVAPAPTYAPEDATAAFPAWAIVVAGIGGFFILLICTVCICCNRAQEANRRTGAPFDAFMAEEQKIELLPQTAAEGAAAFDYRQA